MSLPRATRLTAALLSGTLLLPVSPARGDHTLRHQRDVVRSQITQTETEMGEASRQLRRSTARLETAARALAAARRELNALRVELDAAIQDRRRATQRLSAARADLSRIQTRLAGSQRLTQEKGEDVAASVVSVYKEGDPQLLAFASMLEAQDPSDLLRRDVANEAIVSGQEQAFDALRAAEIMLEVEETQARDAAERVAAASRAAAAAVASQRHLTASARAATRTTALLVDRRRKARREAAQIKARDLEVLRRLEAKEERIRAAIRRAAIKAAARKPNHATSSPANGYLVRPVEGMVTSPFGYRIHPIYKYWSLHDGIDFGAPCGQPLIAAADGVVTSSYNSSVYGRRLFIRAGIAGGRSLTLIYNHAAGYRVQTGDAVRRGDVIGAVGDTGWSTGCHLHFTVLADGSARDPELWF